MGRLTIHPWTDLYSPRANDCKPTITRETPVVYANVKNDLTNLTQLPVGGNALYLLETGGSAFPWTLD